MRVSEWNAGAEVTAPPRSNTPPADELAAVRDQIKDLERRERELKALMLTDPSARTGNQWMAEIREIETSRVDLKELRACHPDITAEFTFPAKTVSVVLKEINEDGEVPPASKPKRRTG